MSEGSAGSALVLERRLAAGVASVSFNRPEKRNALNNALLAELCAALDRLSSDATLRVILLQGEGTAFCAGLDLNENLDPASSCRGGELLTDALQKLAESRAVTLAVVRGYAVGGGAALMSACDLAYASTEARIGYPVLKQGLTPSPGMVFLRRQMSERAIREWLLTGELVSAQQAHDWQLVNRVLEGGALADECLRLAREISAGGPDAVARTKQLYSELWPGNLRADLQRALDAFKRQRLLPEAEEGLKAFAEKRAPAWASR